MSFPRSSSTEEEIERADDRTQLPVLAGGLMLAMLKKIDNNYRGLIVARGAIPMRGVLIISPKHTDLLIKLLVKRIYGRALMLAEVINSKEGFDIRIEFSPSIELCDSEMCEIISLGKAAGVSVSAEEGCFNFRGEYISEEKRRISAAATPRSRESILKLFEGYETNRP